MTYSTLDRELARKHGRQTVVQGRTDLATMFGLLVGAGMLLTAVAMGGNARSFIDIPSMLIVLGGTFAVVTICFSLADVATTLHVVLATLAKAAPNPAAAALRALRLADDARRLGPLHLESRLREFETAPFLHKALTMVVDALPEAEIEDVLRYELQTSPQRFRRSAAVLRKAADYAPAMGLIGTLIGLVQMLGQLDQPNHIGPAMAVALLTTFYGAVLANMVLSPLAVKLERIGHDEELVCHLYLLAALSITRQENPRRLEMLFNSVLPPGQRLRYFK